MVGIHTDITDQGAKPRAPSSVMRSIWSGRCAIASGAEEQLRLLNETLVARVGGGNRRAPRRRGRAAAGAKMERSAS